MRRPLACGQLCRPEVGVPWRPVPSPRMAVSLPCGVMRRSSDAPPAGLRPAVPTGGRRSPGGRCHLHEWRCLCLAASCGGAAMRRPLACGQLCRPEVGVPRRLGPSARMALSPPRGAIRGSSDAPPAGLRPAVPTGGRRSPAAGAICANGGVFALRRHAGEQQCAARWPAASRADRRSAFPGGRCHLREWRCLHPAASCRGAAMNSPRRGPPLCRPEGGVSSRSRASARSAVRGFARLAARETGAPLSRAVPRIGGRRYPPGRASPAGGSISPLWRFERPSFSWVGDCSWSHWPGS